MSAVDATSETELTPEIPEWEQIGEAATPRGAPKRNPNAEVSAIHMHQPMCAGAPTCGVVHAGSAFHPGRSAAQEAYDEGYAAFGEAREELFFKPPATLRAYALRNAEQACVAVLNGDVRGHFLHAFKAAAAFDLLEGRKSDAVLDVSELIV